MYHVRRAAFICHALQYLQSLWPIVAFLTCTCGSAEANLKCQRHVGTKTSRIPDIEPTHDVVTIANSSWTSDPSGHALESDKSTLIYIDLHQYLATEWFLRWSFWTSLWAQQCSCRWPSYILFCSCPEWNKQNRNYVTLERLVVLLISRCTAIKWIQIAYLAPCHSEPVWRQVHVKNTQYPYVQVTNCSGKKQDSALLRDTPCRQKSSEPAGVCQLCTWLIETLFSATGWLMLQLEKIDVSPAVSALKKSLMRRTRCMQHRPSAYRAYQSKQKWIHELSNLSKHLIAHCPSRDTWRVPRCDCSGMRQSQYCSWPRHAAIALEGLARKTSASFGDARNVYKFSNIAACQYPPPLPRGACQRSLNHRWP